MALISIQAARCLLPEVGDQLKKVPTGDPSWGGAKPLPCEVIYVNRAHLWYMVRFESGRRESYKVPEYNPRGGALD